MNVRRGLIAATVGAVLGAALTLLILQVYQLFKGHFIFDEYVPPVIGCSSILAAAAWATYAPNAKNSLAWTLAIIAIVSLVLSFVLIGVFVPLRTKMDPPMFHFYPAMAILTLSPFFAAGWLTWRRVRRPSSIL